MKQNIRPSKMCSMIVKALKIAGVEEIPVWKAIKHILDDKRVEIHIHTVRK